jgi:hypothetical protein
MVLEPKHVAHMAEMRTHKMLWLENLKGRDYLQDLDVEGKTILNILIRRLIKIFHCHKHC